MPCWPDVEDLSLPSIAYTVGAQQPFGRQDENSAQGNIEVAHILWPRKSTWGTSWAMKT